MFSLTTLEHLNKKGGRGDSRCDQS